MTVGGPESRAEERELSCVQFSQTVYRRQTGVWNSSSPDTLLLSLDNGLTIKQDSYIKDALFQFITCRYSEEALI